MGQHLLSLPLNGPVAIFLAVLLIILMAPMLFTRIKVPTIVVLIVMGAVVGPHGLNILARDASFEVFGEVGILYLMFLAAVEIDMNNLRKNARRGIIFGLLTFLVPVGIGIFVTRYCFATGWDTAVLVAAMYGSHTLISYPIVDRFGLSSSRSVVVTLCATIVAVLLTLIVLAQVVAVKADGRFAWINVAYLLFVTAVYALVVGWTFPRITRWFFTHYSTPVTQFIFVLAMVLLASLLSQLIGLEAILGAFYAGLILNRFIPGRSALLRRIKFVGNAVFIPYFLIGVGMLINLRDVLSSWHVIYVAAVMTATALITKWLVALLGRKMFGYSAVEGRIMFGLSSGKAAATIAAAMIGFRYGLVGEDLMNGAVVMILVCSAVASFVTEHAAQRLRIKLTEKNLKRSADADTRQNARQLVAVANPGTAAEIMHLALLMRHPSNTNPVTALFVRTDDDPRRTALGRYALQTAEDTAQTVDTEVRTLERYDTNVVSGMVNVMKERNVTDLIIGLHRRVNFVDTFYGTITEQLLTASNAMVTMSRCFMPVDTMKRIVVVAPANAEYETGFRLWVERVGNLATQIQCHVWFIAFPDTSRYIKGVLRAEGYEIEQTHSALHAWDDFITYSGQVDTDDLLIMIGARRTSVSFTHELESLPVYLSRYFAGQNLMVIYPEQFGDAQPMPTPIEMLAQPFSTNPTPLALSLRRIKEIFNRHIQ